MKKTIHATTRDPAPIKNPPRKAIGLLSAEDALEAARLTGYHYTSVRRTDWGFVCDGQYPFCFRMVGDELEMGIPGILTPNVGRVVDFLRERGYKLEQTDWRETSDSTLA